MSEKKEKSETKIEPKHLFAEHPLRALIQRTMQRKGLTPEEVSKAMGFEAVGPLRLYLNGLIKLPFDRLEALAKALDLDPTHLLRLALEEFHPELLELLERLPAPPLLTATERRMITHLRTYTDDMTAELVVADGANLVAVVMAR